MNKTDGNNSVQIFMCIIEDIKKLLIQIINKNIEENSDEEFIKNMCDSYYFYTIPATGETVTLPQLSDFYHAIIEENHSVLVLEVLVNLCVKNNYDLSEVNELIKEKLSYNSIYLQQH